MYRQWTLNSLFGEVFISCKNITNSLFEANDKNDWEPDTKSKKFLDQAYRLVKAEKKNLEKSPVLKMAERLRRASIPLFELLNKIFGDVDDLLTKIKPLIRSIQKNDSEIILDSKLEKCESYLRELGSDLNSYLRLRIEKNVQIYYEGITAKFDKKDEKIRVLEKRIKELEGQVQEAEKVDQGMEEQLRYRQALGDYNFFGKGVKNGGSYDGALTTVSTRASNFPQSYDLQQFPSKKQSNQENFLSVQFEEKDKIIKKLEKDLEETKEELWCLQKEAADAKKKSEKEIASLKTTIKNLPREVLKEEYKKLEAEYASNSAHYESLTPREGCPTCQKYEFKVRYLKATRKRKFKTVQTDAFNRGYKKGFKKCADRHGLDVSHLRLKDFKLN